jgi:hypothetical protein
MTVRVRDHEAEDASWGSGLFAPAIRTVTIPAVCPTCGGPRGAARGFNQHEDGVWFNVDVWDNPCGHVDYYRAVIREAGSAANR